MKLRVPLISFSAAVILSVTALADFRDHTGIQLYSLKSVTLSKGLPASLDLVKGWGVKEVEGGGSAGTLTTEQIRAEFDSRGLKAPSIHVQYDALTKDVAAVIKEAKTLGASYAICPWIPHKEVFDAATAQKAINDFNTWGAAFHAAGIKFGYHPHGYEFVPGAAAGDTLLDEIIRGTKSENVTFEMDVFWVYHGGGDPVTLLKKYPTRWSAMHLKDIRKGAPHGQPTGHAPATDNVAVGTGEIDWKAVIGTAEKVGVKYYFIEDETPAPLESIPASLAFIRALKL